MEIFLKEHQCSSAADIQLAIDRAAASGGGRIALPQCEVVLDRGIQLRSNVELVGGGAILKKAPSRVYPLSGYHNYGMFDVPLSTTEGLEPGMTVSIHDSKTLGNFFETFATITWVEDNWVGIDRPLKSDYGQENNPELTTAFPLISGHRIKNASVRNVYLDGNLPENPARMGGCRGGSVYFDGCRGITIDQIRECEFNGEGLSFQMCSEVFIIDSEFSRNTGNGLHPGAGSTNVVFERCRSDRNERSGFFFCVRANHITVRNCEFSENDSGISIGTRDCYNLIENCRISANRNCGLIIRDCSIPTEVHSCVIRNCEFEGNGSDENGREIRIGRNCHDLIFENNRMERRNSGRPDMTIDPTSKDLFFDPAEKWIMDCARQSVVGARSEFTCGYQENLDPGWTRHLASPR